MRSLRLASLATALGLITAAVTMGSASAATPGVGTSSVGTTVASLELGDLLSADILSDDSQSSIDKAVGTPEAATVLRPLHLNSVISGLNLDLPPIEVRTTGAESRQEVAAIDIDQQVDTALNAVPALADLAPSLVQGTLAPASLAAVVDTVGARSGLNSELVDLVAGGGLASVDRIAGNLGTDAATADSDGIRGLDVDTISALNLGALLEGLGISLTDLDADAVSGLLDELGLLGATGPVADLIAQIEDASGIDLPAVDDAADLSGIITTVTDADSDAIADLELCETAGDTVGDLTGGLPTTGPISSLPGVDTDTLCADALDDLLAALPSADLLGGLLGILDGLSLLSLDTLDAGIVAKATDDVKSSAASVTAQIGTIRVGNVAIPGVDLLATAQSLAAKVDTVTSQLDAVLGLVGVPAVGDLAGILDVKLLDTTGTGVTKDGNYVKAVANLTGVTVTITPPANLADIVDGLGDGTSVLEQLTALDAAAPAGLTMPNTDAMRTLENALTVPTAPGTAALVPSVDGAVQALAGGATLSLASLSGTSTFAPQIAGQPATPGAPSELPRTGTSTNAAGLAALGMVLGALAIGIRRHVLIPVRVDEK